MLGTVPMAVGRGLWRACGSRQDLGLLVGLREAPALMEAVARGGAATPAGDHRDGFQGDRRQKGVSSVCRVGSMRPERDGA